ncbi:MAG: selenocysteine-specific translation elongation factor [Anaerolineae bacterium]|nr:selenocysteine-specific translation elongation factor [Anaerolineae bacterium]
MPYVIGTAGHVDHGKSSLVEALTGIDPDRLVEEKARRMTIDLGFAWLTLPGGKQVGIVDVPGHRDFIENMLAGVGGIDVALFVVAADEGVMPQTREHLAILDLLEVSDGVIALTKSDLIDDLDWLDLVSLDIAEITSQTVLKHAPIIPVSARTGQGLDQLLNALEEALADRPPRPDRGRPRLPVDRVFTISGFGTVVTGTLTGGSLAVGDEVEIVPPGRKTRIRGLQSHKEDIRAALPGSRIAINLGGVSKEHIRRGDVIALPGLLDGTTLVDVHFRHLPDVERPLKHNTQVKLFCGAAETVAYVRLLGHQELLPGTEGWLQLRLEDPLALDKGDRFILRYPSPPQTIGGGVVLDPHPPHRWRRFKPEVISRLETLAAGSAEDLLLQTLEEHPALTLQQLPSLTGLGMAEVMEALDILQAHEEVIAFPDDLLMAGAAWARLSGQITQELRAYHDLHPLRLGMPREALRSHLKIEGKLSNHLIELASRSNLLVDEGMVIRLPEHSVHFTKDEQTAIEQLWDAIRDAPTSPPSIKEATAIVGLEVLQALFEQGRLIQLSSDVLLDTDTYHRLVQEVEEFIKAQGSITVAQARDLFNTSRKYVLALLEHLDATGKTRRGGDERVLK